MAALAAEVETATDGDMLEMNGQLPVHAPHRRAVEPVEHTIDAPGTMSSNDMKPGRTSRVDEDASHVAAVGFDDRPGRGGSGSLASIQGTRRR